MKIKHINWSRFGINLRVHIQFWRDKDYCDCLACEWARETYGRTFIDRYGPHTRESIERGRLREIYRQRVERDGINAVCPPELIS